MRVAVVSDIHGNLTAFETVLADIRRCSPDLVLHGGDLADGGSSPVERARLMQRWKSSLARSAGRSLSLGILIGLSFAALLGNRDS
jgi:predicted phosphodiesterase